VKRLIAVSLFTPCHPKNMMQQQQISKETPNKRQLQPSFKIKKTEPEPHQKTCKAAEKHLQLGDVNRCGVNPWLRGCPMRRKSCTSEFAKNQKGSEHCRFTTR
jgi:hypothetical protein